VHLHPLSPAMAPICHHSHAPTLRQPSEVVLVPAAAAAAAAAAAVAAVILILAAAAAAAVAAAAAAATYSYGAEACVEKACPGADRTLTA
jgi:hypothetical protein